MRKILLELSKRKALERRAYVSNNDTDREEDRIFLNNQSNSRLNYMPLSVASPDVLSPRTADRREWQPLEARNYLRTEIRGKKTATHVE